MEIDIHLHSEYSRCSRFMFSDLLRKIDTSGTSVATVTDHGVTEGWERLVRERPELLVIPGVEVRAREGDFLVFSEDSDYIRSIGPYATSITDIRRDNSTAVIWAHPRIASKTGWKAPNPEHHLVLSIVPYIDAIEVFNNNMFEDKSLTQAPSEYAICLARVARAHGLPMSGGSDAHSASNFMKCGTSFASDVGYIRDFIRQIKSGEIRPVCNDSSRASSSIPEFL